MTHNVHKREISAGAGTPNKEVKKEDVPGNVVEDQNSGNLKLR